MNTQTDDWPAGHKGVPILRYSCRRQPGRSGQFERRIRTQTPWGSGRSRFREPSEAPSGTAGSSGRHSPLTAIARVRIGRAGSRRDLHWPAGDSGAVVVGRARLRSGEIDELRIARLTVDNCRIEAACRKAVGPSRHMRDCRSSTGGRPCSAPVHRSPGLRATFIVYVRRPTSQTQSRGPCIPHLTFFRLRCTAAGLLPIPRR